MVDSFERLLMQSRERCQTLQPSSNLEDLTTPPRVFPYDTGNIREWYDMNIFTALGSGTSSTMFKCFERGSTTWKPPCACKVIPKVDPFNTFPKIRQVKILFALLHQPNIITLHDVFEDANYVYLVMELGNGGELLEDFNRRFRSADPAWRSALSLYSEAEAASIMFQIMSVIQACQSVGVVHRDLKPENVLIVDKDENGFPIIKVIDFGLSIFTQPDEVLHELIGTPLYIAPEVTQHAYGGEADVWSAGCIMFILLCGYHPFQCALYGGMRELIAAQTNLESLLFQVPNRVVGFDSISSATQDLLRNMLTVDSSKRLTVDKFF